MSHFTLLGQLVIHRTTSGCDACYDYAVSELVRLLARSGVDAHFAGQELAGQTPGLVLSGTGGKGTGHLPCVSSVKYDGYVIGVTPDVVAIAAPSAKGVLNGIYDLAERLGYVFLLPGEEGEWPPSAPLSEIRLPVGTTTVNPRFRFRGVMWEPSADSFAAEEVLRFHAKLRFNTVCIHRGAGLEGTLKAATDCLELAGTLGLRLEACEHSLSEMLPRDLFDAHPEMFRLPQPEDICGTRMLDRDHPGMAPAPDATGIDDFRDRVFNLCPTHVHGMRVVRENFRKHLRSAKGIDVLHVWPDDVTGGGWCYCSSCRGLSPSDQAMLAIRNLAKAAAQEGMPTRLSVLAYHDTLFPGANIHATPEMLLFFAGRERCYGHALDDENCACNRRYLEALAAWVDFFKESADPHCFNYYLDPQMFRGMTPFLPQMILGDLSAYQAQGIATILTAQLEAPEAAPYFNLLVFAAGAWDARLTAEDFVGELCARILPEQPALLGNYLMKRSRIFTDALKACDWDPRIYADYRWLPETSDPAAEEMARACDRGSKDLASAVGDLERGAARELSAPVRRLIEAEVSRAHFEVSQLALMASQQRAVCHLGRYLDTDGLDELRTAADALEEAQECLRNVAEEADKYGLLKGSRHYRYMHNAWEDEIARKIASCREALAEAKGA